MLFTSCISVYFVCFFFFKQKTAYEMRISDWSSDVCSSDLSASAAIRLMEPGVISNRCQLSGERPRTWQTAARMTSAWLTITTVPSGTVLRISSKWSAILRSEEHTSELQSLMRISYAVFCLKKKTITKQYNTA